MKIPSSSSVDSVVRVDNLSCSFGAKRVLDGVSMYVPRGTVFGLVGENGAGKTTLIKHLLGLLTPQSGEVRLFGHDPVLQPVEVLQRIGYMSENRDLPAWMKIGDLFRFNAAFYPGWDASFASQLCEKFHLDRAARVRTLSQGQQAKAALLLSLAYRPELLILDEPSTGLDPVVRRDILEAIIRTVAQEGRTVFFSSHLLDEIERVSDQVAMIHQGRIVLHGPLDEVKQSHRRLVLWFDEAPATTPSIPGALSISGAGREWRAICNGKKTEAATAAAALGAKVVEEQTPSLDEIFVARVKGTEVV